VILLRPPIHSLQIAVVCRARHETDDCFDGSGDKRAGLCRAGVSGAAAASRPHTRGAVSAAGNRDEVCPKGCSKFCGVAALGEVSPNGRLAGSTSLVDPLCNLMGRGRSGGRLGGKEGPTISGGEEGEGHSRKAGGDAADGAPDVRA